MPTGTFIIRSFPAAPVRFLFVPMCPFSALKCCAYLKSIKVFKFLRHIERCKILLHLMDVSEDKLEENYLKVRNELSKYDKILTKKKEIIVFNKSDLVLKKEIDKKLKIFKKKIKKKHEIISVIADKNLINLRKILLKNVNK